MKTKVFDNVFRTLVERMPSLAIAVINEVFGTTYSDDIKIEQLRNEFHTVVDDASGEIITDSCLLIDNKIYHLECQSTEDDSMAIRIVEYDFHIALNKATKVQGIYQIRFPSTCVIYLREHKGNLEKVNIVFPDGETKMYAVPAISVGNYSSDDIFAKKLFFFLPFYILRYEKELKEIEANTERLRKLCDEYKAIMHQLDAKLPVEKKEQIYRDLHSLMITIIDYVCRNTQNTRKGVKSNMGGKILPLPSDILRQERVEGMAEGRAEGRTEGRTEGMILSLGSLVKKGVLTIDEGATEAHMTVEEFISETEKFGFSLET